MGAIRRRFAMAPKRKAITKAPTKVGINSGECVIPVTFRYHGHNVFSTANLSCGASEGMFQKACEVSLLPCEILMLRCG